MPQVHWRIKDAPGLTFRRRPIFYVVACAAVLAEIIALSTVPSIQHYFALATTHQPEPVTELYLNNFQHLPKSLAPAEEASFSFHLTNLMAATTTYQYEVADLSNGTVQVLASGTVVLVNGQGDNQTVHFSLPQANNRSQVIVELKSPAEHVDFWTTTS